VIRMTPDEVRLQDPDEPPGEVGKKRHGERTSYPVDRNSTSERFALRRAVGVISVSPAAGSPGEWDRCREESQ
jgi:hypothetical protein